MLVLIIILNSWLIPKLIDTNYSFTAKLMSFSTEKVPSGCAKPCWIIRWLQNASSSVLYSIVGEVPDLDADVRNRLFCFQYSNHFTITVTVIIVVIVVNIFVKTKWLNLERLYFF